MSKHEKVMEDKYASSAANFKDPAAKIAPTEKVINLAQNDMSSYASVERAK